MDQRAQYLLQILEKIGAPLLGAAISVSDGAPEEAQIVAQALSKTVQASIDLGQVMDVNPVEAGDDSLRVALAGLSGPLVAAQIQKRGGVPEEADVKKITGSLQAVLTFADNFTPSTDNIQRLENLQASGQVVDAHQVAVQYVEAFIPVVQAIAAFSFGQAEQKLIGDATQRLVQRATEMREALVPDATGDDQKRIELGLLRSLGAIYSACHREQTAKASAGNAETPPTIDAVWTDFDLQSGMLEALAKNLVPGAAAASSGSGTVSPSVSAVEVPAEQPVEVTAPPPPPPPPEVPVETPPVSEASPAQPTAGNPMAGFAKKKPVEDTPPQTPPQEVPVQPPPAETPPPPPAQEQQSDEGSGGEDSGDSSGGGSANPMGFFKKSD